MDALSNKKYWDIPGNSPELVICFLPAESILAAALTADAALLDYALSRNVVLASPRTLLAVLKSVAFTWRQDVLTDSARELFELARQLYERMGTLGENVAKLGASLKSSVDRYNSMVGTLEARVLPTARKLNCHGRRGADHAGVRRGHAAFAGGPGTAVSARGCRGVRRLECSA